MAKSVKLLAQRNAIYIRYISFSVVVTLPLLCQHNVNTGMSENMSQAQGAIAE